MSSETVSARIPPELKARLEAEGVDISETIRKALEAEVTARRRRRLCERADEISGGDRPSSDEVVEAVREAREGR